MDSGSWSGIILFLSKWFIQEDPCTHGRTAVCFQFELQGEGDMYKAFYLGWILLRLIQVREWVINTNTPQQGDMQTWKVCSHNISGHGREFLHKQKWVGHGVGGFWSYHHMCHVVSHTADVQLSVPVPRCISDCSVLGQGLLVPCGSVKTGPIPICASWCS